MKIVALLLSCLCSMCFSSDKSDRVPSVNHDNVTNNITITNSNPSPRQSPLYSPRPSPRQSRIAQAGPKHPKVDIAHEELERRRQEDDFITCCCFFKMKKLPLH